jgi:hypothetical protein
MHKYEGKLNFAQFNSEGVAAKERCAGTRLFCEGAVPFILAAKSFQEMFTSYSQLLPFCPASGLESRNRR